ncbi:MAG: Hpt domain-containing protein [Cellvibrionaceae bacterium]
MADNRNFAALDWVVGEIDETLKQARQSLEAYVENPQDSTRIRFCLTHIHQVHGSLQMVEFFGAALLAEEMEAIAQALMNHDVANEAEAHEVLMRAILQLPIYLEQVKVKRNDDPGSLLPLLNDLRAARGSSLLSESQFFSPDISPAQKVSGEKNPAQANAAQYKAVLEKLRKMYQYAASGVIKGVKVDENIKYLEKVFTRLHALTSGTARQPLWDIALAVVEGLDSEQIQISVSLKSLMRQLDKEIRLLAEHGAKALNSFTREELIKNLLYYVARSHSETPRILRLRKEYSLDSALPENQSSNDADNNLLSGPDPETMRTVVGALNDELGAIKDALDVGVNELEPAAVEDALQIMKRVADTLAVLGVADLRKQILDQTTNLESAASRDEISNDVLMGVADEIIAVEQRLAALASASASSGTANQSTQQVQIDQAQETVLREARNGLEQAKDAIIEYIASQWERSHLTNVPKLLEEIRGGLAIIPLDRPAAILQGCSQYIENELLSGDSSPEWSALDTLADAIASVEYFLERISGDREDDDEVLLTLAEESIASLGYGVDGTSRPESVVSVDRDASAESTLGKLADIESVAIDSLPQTQVEDDSIEALVDTDASAEIDSSEEPQEPQGLELQDSSELQDGSELQNSADEDDQFQSLDAESTVSSEPGDFASFDDVLVTSGSEIDTEPSGSEAEQSQLESESESQSQSQQEQVLEIDAEVESASDAAINSDLQTEDTSAVEDEDEIDEEILEIFVEEAGECLEAIDEFFPQWAADFDDNESLTEFRRAFHTLKGSGRMVGANDVGELAWTIESVLNRIIDGSLKPHTVQVALITQVRATLPQFIDAFEHRQPNPNPELAQHLMALGEAVIRGEKPEELLQDSGEQFVASDDASSIETGVNEEVSSSANQDSNTVDEQEDDSNEILWEIFGGEAISHLQVVEQFIAEMRECRPLYTPPSESMQRALHTLKGSAHMADVRDIAELATPLERFAKELRTYQVNIDDDILQLFNDGALYTHDALSQIRESGSATIEKLPQFLARVAELRDLSVGPLIRQEEARQEKAVDPELLSIFMAEEMNLLLDADEIIQQWKNDSQNPEKIDSLITELNTLAKGAEHACLPPMADISHQLSALYSSANGNLESVQSEDFDTLLIAHDKLLDMVDAVAAGQNLRELTPELQQRLTALQGRVNESAIADESTDPSLELSEPDATGLEDSDAQNSENTMRTDIAEAISMAEDGVEIDSDIEVIDVDVLGELDDDIAEGFIDAVGEDLEVLASVDLGEIIVDTGEVSSADSDQGDGSDLADFSEESVDEPQVAEQEASSSEPEFSIPEVAASADSVEQLDDDEDIDPEIVEIFLDEADELMEDIERTMHEWSEDWDQRSSTEELKRALHTLKGGARLSGMTAVGDVSHDFETDVIQVADNHTVDEAFFDRGNDFQDLLLKGIALVKAAMIGEGNLAEALKGQAIYSDAQSPADSSNDSSQEAVVESPASTETPASVETTASAPETDSADILPFLPKDNVPVVSSGDEFNLPDTTATEPANAVSSGGAAPTPMQARRNAPQEVVKVSAELLEELVNLAGETSISRGRMEEQVSELGFAIDEMDSTISRLQEQLRRLDIETQAQMLFRQEQMAESEEFDPLEMDRYSQLQQLSRSLIESASDLMDLKSTLSDKTRDTETLLLQQSRINTDLQEGLMRSRMVPFARLVPRLRRIVRQVSGELDKRVNFELDNVEGELDRTVLERMVAPLEHMLRNAVDHGIESPEERLAAGKPESGRIVLTLTREGGDVMLRLIDDGRGIDLKRVKEKAIERGLMSEEANLSDRDVMQFILHAGFSTAENVTQISGRGVGMDVVHSEIKQLGGAMSINSRWGEGTEFTVRLPFTVSVNRALMVRIGEDRYAVPLNTIEGIVRVSPFELEHYYQDEQARFEYAGEQYQVRYLGNLLNSDARPKLEGQAMPLPVVLVRTAQNAVAMQVDMLMGSREVVVKSLGPQFGLVQGVSGATVMGDGSVVVILDPHAMIRQEAALVHGPENLLEPDTDDTFEEHVKTVMVVDDSVTVRKVTTRFLEREGYEVMTAKDGADALLQLQDHVPDAMLLDIEMPRMDGFEVAKNIRSSSRLKDIPIIMITSRTGDKHRDRALSLGVNKYMGKPYQEDKLLHNIRVVTGDEEESLEADDTPAEE